MRDKPPSRQRNVSGRKLVCGCTKETKNSIHMGRNFLDRGFERRSTFQITFPAEFPSWTRSRLSRITVPVFSVTAAAFVADHIAQSVVKKPSAADCRRLPHRPTSRDFTTLSTVVHVSLHRPTIAAAGCLRPRLSRVEMRAQTPLSQASVSAEGGGTTCREPGNGTKYPWHQVY